MPKLSVVVTVNSEVAFEELDGESLLSIALSTANNFCIETSLPNKLYIAAQNISEVRKATQGLNFEYQELRCNPSDPLDLAAAVRDLDRGLSAGEKRMLAKAKQILVSELALAERTDEEKAATLLDEVLAS